MSYLATMLSTPVATLDEHWRRANRKSVQKAQPDAKKFLSNKSRAFLEATKLKLQTAFPGCFTSGDIAIELDVPGAKACRWCAQMVKHGYATQVGISDLTKRKPAAIYGWVK